jgi:hypothetical protein
LVLLQISNNGNISLAESAISLATHHSYGQKQNLLKLLMILLSLGDGSNQL